MPGEFELIDRIRRRVGAGDAGGRVPLGIGDDCAALAPTPGRQILVTTDMLMDGRHFRLGEATPEQVGCKLLAVNLSDIAAMAGTPIAAFLAVALPRAAAAEIARGLVEGMAPLLDRSGVSLAGGDTNAWDGPLVATITLVGEAGPAGPVLRSGARPGDAILVTGPLGGSLLGRHLRPEPRLAEARALAAAAPIRAMIDLSDGLAGDLARILAESGGLGATLGADSVPVHPDARIMAATSGRTPLDHALRDGEDFELCLTLAPADAERLLRDPPPGVVLHRVGTIDAGPGIRLAHPDGLVEPIEGGGFDHLAGEIAP